MAGIPVTPDPAALLRGGEALNRSALPVSRLAALLPPVLPAADGGVAPGDNTLVRGGGTVAPERGELTGAGSGQNGSTRETLSFAARAILHVLDGEGQSAPPNAPVLRTVPTGTPAQVATALRQALHQLVQQSGLFYESHLAEWVQGGRPLAELKSEPQARLASPPPPPSAPPSSPDGRPAAPAGQGTGAHGAALPSQPVLLLPAPTAPAGSAAAATLTHADGADAREGPARGDGATRPGDKPVAGASTGKPGARQLDPLPARSPSELLAKQVANAAGAYESVAQGNHARREVIFEVTSVSSLAASDQPAAQARNDAATANPIHPGTEGLVRQQLELLATQQFRWSGEAWPDVPMEWEVSRRQGDGGAAEADQPWSTRLVVDLPRLGRIEARLTLNGTGLEAAVSTVRGETASRLNDTRSAFSGNLSANGLVLMRLTVSPGLPETKVGQP